MPRTPKRGWEYPPGTGELLQKIFEAIDSDMDEAISTAAGSHHIVSPTHADVITTGSVSTGDVLYWNGSSWMPKNIGSNFVYSSASLNLTNVSATIGSAGISLSVDPPSGGDTSKFLQAWELEGTNTAGVTSATQGSKLYLEGGNRVTISGTSNTLILSVKDSDLMNTSERAAFQYTSATSIITSAAFAAANSTKLLNTSQSSLFQQTSATSAITSNAMNTSERAALMYTSAGMFSSERSNYIGSTERSNFVHTSASLDLTNISATLGSNSISLSVGNYITTAMASDAGSLFMQTTERGDLQYTSATSAITSNAMNTSERGDLQYTSANSNFAQAWELVGANTAGATSSMMGSKLYLSGADRITLSGTANTIKISANITDLYVLANSTRLLQGVDIIGNTSGTSAFASFSRLHLSGGNRATLVGSASTVGVSVYDADLMVTSERANYMETGERTNYMGSTERSNLVHTSASLNLTNISATLGSAGVSLSVGNYLTTAMASGDSTKFVQAWELNGNTVGDASSSLAGSKLYLSGGNRITISATGNTLGVSAQVSDLFVAANSTLLAGSSVASRVVGIAGSNASTASGVVQFANSNNMTFGLNGNTITASASFSQSAQPAQTGISGIGASNTTYTSGTVIHSAQANITISTSINGASQYVQYSVGDYLTSQSNQAFSADASSTFQTLAFQNSNGVSFSNNLGSLRVTHALQYTSNTSAITSNAANTSITSRFIQAWELSGKSSGTQSSLQGSKIYFSGDSRIVVSGNSNTIAISADVSDLMNIIESTNFAGSSVSSRVVGIAGSNASTASGIIKFANSNNMTFGLNGSTITASASFAQSVQPAVGQLNGSSGTMSISGASNITASNNNSTITIYGPASVLFGVSVSGNTGTTGSSAVVNSGFVLAGGNNVTLSQSNNTISIIAPSPAGATAISGLGASNTTYSSGTVIFSNQANITVGTSLDGASQYVRLSVAAQTAQTGISGLGASNTTYSSGTVIMSNQANITIGTSVDGASQYVRFSVAASHAQQTGISGLAGSAASTVTAGTVQFSNANSISFGLNGSTMTASYMQWLSSYEVVPPLGATGALSFQTNTSGPMSLWGFEIPHGVLADHIGIIASMSYDGTGQSSYRQSGTLGWALYTRPTAAASTQLDSWQSSSFTYGVTYNSNTLTISYPATTGIGAPDYTYLLTSSAGNNLTTLFTGVKIFYLNCKMSLTPGHYWLGLHHRNSSTSHNYGLRMSLHGPAQTLTGLLPFGLSAIQSTGTNLYAHWGGHWNPFGAASYSLAGMAAVGSRLSISQLTANLTVFPYIRLASRITV